MSGYLDQESGQEESSAIELLEQMIQEAMKVQGSDIHLEPLDSNNTRIRIRRDGFLYTAMNLDFLIGQRVISRLKVLSGLNIAEKRLPQDGRFSVQLEGQPSVDMRVSTCPVRLGEKVVLRLQNTRETCLELFELGFEQESLNLLHSALSKSQGMILVTGPTGSGKTLTLYSALQQLNIISKNICTVEDPIEMPLKGVMQVQIQPKINLNFATVLSAFLRQDPDIIMVGEIRDIETAEIGIKAAQTGHLVLSTLHTNNALETLTRLSGMGIPRYAIASSVSLVIAQRLVRRLCVDCKQIESDKFIHELVCDRLKSLGVSPEKLSQAKLFKSNPMGCNQCHQGFRGRTGCFEVIPITEDLKNLILQGANILEMQAYCEKQNYWNLWNAGVSKILNGETTLEEIAGVI